MDSHRKDTEAQLVEDIRLSLEDLKVAEYDWLAVWGDFDTIRRDATFGF